MKSFFGSLCFTITLVLSVVFLLPCFIVLGCLSWNLRVRLMRWWCLLILKALSIFCGVSYQIKGLENCSQTPVIYISNHSSALETILLAAYLPSHSVILKRSLLWIPIWGWSMAMMKPIAINRKKGKAAFKNMLKTSAERVAEGQSILIFPEGTRSINCELLPFKKGAFLLAHELALPIINISHNAGLIWKKGSFLKKSGTVKVTISEPMFDQNASIDEMMAASKAWIQNHYLS